MPNLDLIDFPAKVWVGVVVVQRPNLDSNLLYSSPRLNKACKYVRLNITKSYYIRCILRTKKKSKQYGCSEIMLVFKVMVLLNGSLDIVIDIIFMVGMYIMLFLLIKACQKYTILIEEKVRGSAWASKTSRQASHLLSWLFPFE